MANISPPGKPEFFVHGAIARCIMPAVKCHHGSFHYDIRFAAKAKIRTSFFPFFSALADVSTVNLFYSSN